IAMSAPGAPLPCELASEPCANRTGLLACVDTLFTIDGTCGTTPDVNFSHFTALPPPNNYQALCVDPIPPCTDRATEFRFTMYAAGILLVPMDWSGILVGQSVPIARLLRASTSLAAFPDNDRPIRLPSQAFLTSFSTEGQDLPPIFEPQADPTSPNELV